MKYTDFNSLFVHELKDLLDAETRLTKALPKMAESATNEYLRTAFEGHLRETSGHKERLEKILKDLGESPRGTKCPAMEGLIQEGEDVLSHGAKAEPEVRDAALIAAAQRVEHYEIAGYGAARTFARILGHTRAEQMLQQTLEEEHAADRKLTEIAEQQVNQAAAAVR